MNVENKRRPRVSSHITKIKPDDLLQFQSLLVFSIKNYQKRVIIKPWDLAFKAVSVRDFTEQEYERLLEVTYDFINSRGFDPENNLHKREITKWIYNAYSLWNDGPVPSFEALKQMVEEKRANQEQSI